MFLVRHKTVLIQKLIRIKPPISVEVTDISKYTKLNGEHFENKPAPAVTLTIYTFKKVLLHPDGSIVINVNNPNVGGSIKNLSISLLQLELLFKQNWQTGEQINDITDKILTDLI